MSLHLHGDSIFDNKSYVPDNEAVEDHLDKVLPGMRHILWANDGDTTRETYVILKDLHKAYEDNADVYAVLSVGGNDALQAAHIMATPVNTVEEAFEAMGETIQTFRMSYERVIDMLMDNYVKENIAIATIYDKIPGELIGVGPSQRLALGLFNNVITEIASRRGLKLLDLRVVCNDPSHYSEVSPIEPSSEGGYAIAQAIAKTFNL